MTINEHKWTTQCFGRTETSRISAFTNSPGWLQDPVGDPSTEYEQDITTIYICNKYIYISLTNSLFQKLELKMPYITFTNLYILYG